MTLIPRFSIITKGLRPDSMLSIPHLIIIFLVTLIVLGPEKLPEVARTLSKVMLEFRRATGGLRETFEQELRQLEREVNEAKNPAPAHAPPPSAPALTTAADSSPSGEAPPERFSEPADTADLAATADNPFHAESTEDVNPEEPAESRSAADAVPGKPTDGHSTAA